MLDPISPGFWSRHIPVVLFLTFAGAAAAPPSRTLDTHGCAVQPEGYLDARLAFWQQRMGLTEWKISMVLSHAGDLKPKTLGNVHWDSIQKTAVIRALDASDYRVSCHEALPDMEMTLVHELVHLELASLPRSPASRHEEELAVNRLADALMRQEGVRTGSDAARTSACGASTTW
ncbi:MAG: hypothetical protein ABSF64_21585 [Bryobacteraceae bacterium]